MLSGKLEKKFPTINEIRELAHKGYETYIREFQNIYRPFKTRQNKMDLLGNLVVTGPKANDVHNICAADARQLVNYCAVWTQFSASSAGTRANSPMLFVTSTRPSLRACAATCMSFTPIGWPSFSKAARMAP